MNVIDWKDAVLTVKDGSTLEAEVRLSEGSIQWTEGAEYEYILDKGQLSGVKAGDQQPIELSLTSIWEHLYTGTSVEDIINGVSPAESTDSDDCAPYACDFVLLFTRVCGVTTHTDEYTFSQFRKDTSSFDIGASTIEFSGKCNTTTVPKVST